MVNFDDITKVDLDFMNKEHEEAAKLINRLEANYKNSNVDAVINDLEVLQQHCIEHFLHEEKEMKLHSYPPYQVHKKEHDRVLMDLDMMLKQLVDHNDLSKISGYILHEFPTWFVQHTGTMDRMTAQFIAQEIQASA